MAVYTFFLSLLAAVASVPAAQAVALVSKYAPSHPIMARDQPTLRWEGTVWPGQPDVTLDVYDVDDLWSKVLSMNPQWVEVELDPSDTQGNYGLRVCAKDAQIGTGNSDEASRLLTKLGALGGYWTIDRPQTCHRLGCGPSTGMYWCNNNKWGIRTSAKALYTHLAHVRDLCCHRSDGNQYSGDPISGVEAFPDDDKEAAFSNVAFGYGVCTDPLEIVPLIYPFPGSYGECRT